MLWLLASCGTFFFFFFLVLGAVIGCLGHDSMAYLALLRCIVSVVVIRCSGVDLISVGGAGVHSGTCQMEQSGSSATGLSRTERTVGDYKHSETSGRISPRGVLLARDKALQ